MRAKLISQWGAQKGSEFRVGAEASIGRGGDNDVRIDAKPVSSQHARLFFDPEAGAYFLEDLGSLNGTQIDGTPVMRTERLDRLHVLNFGGVCDLLFVAVDTRPEPEAPAAEAPAAEAPLAGTRVDSEPLPLPEALGTEPIPVGTQVEDVPVALPPQLGGDEASPPAAPVEEARPEPRFALAVVDKGAPRRFPLRDGENLVGRSKGAQVALASRQLSRRHAMLTVDGDRVTVRDLGSRNHTYLEDERIGEGELEVEPRSRLRFGLVEAYLLRHDEDSRTLPVDLA